MYAIRSYYDLYHVLHVLAPCGLPFALSPRTLLSQIEKGAEEVREAPEATLEILEGDPRLGLEAARRPAPSARAFATESECSELSHLVVLLALGGIRQDRVRITSYNVCYTKLLRFMPRP